jgi:hypothetical protein
MQNIGHTRFLPPLQVPARGKNEVARCESPSFANRFRLTTVAKLRDVREKSLAGSVCIDRVRLIARVRQVSAGADRKNPFKMITKCTEVKPEAEKAHLNDLRPSARCVATWNWVRLLPRRSRCRHASARPLFSRHPAQTIIERAITRLLLGYANSALSLQ